ncbi:MAG: phenylacetate--CoA ligase [Clostridia bacterium]|nr:phenylacetate--CoA ligase [Clostridia bacterium]
MEIKEMAPISLDNWIKEKIGFNTERISLQDIKEYQLKKIRQTIDYVCQNSTFYRKRLEGYSGQSLNRLDDLAKLPFTYPQDLRSNALQMLCVSQSDIERVVTLDSSGTTGEPKRLYFTADDQGLTVDFFMQGMSLLTSPGERVLILLPCERPGGIGDLLFKALVRLGAEPIKHGPVTGLSDALQKLSETRASVLVGIPIQVLALAKYWQLKESTIPLNLKRMVLSTDYVSQAVIQEIKRIWGSEVFRYYGMTEMGLGGGIECRHHQGYHLYMGDFVFEIVDPLTGDVLPPGQYGEVVFTTLTRRGMPLVRYRTGDISRFLPGNCPCGSVLPRLDNIKARKTGMVKLTEDSFITIAQLDEILLAVPGVIDFTAVVSNLPGKPTLEIELIMLDRNIDQWQVINELCQTEPIGRAYLKGALKLNLKATYYSEKTVLQTGKRTIKVLTS